MNKVITEEELISFCKEELSMMMGVPAESISADTNFEDMRLNSIHAMQMLDELEDRLNISISPIVFWENPTLASFCKCIVSGLEFRG
jgi:acyl carrier protein